MVPMIDFGRGAVLIAHRHTQYGLIAQKVAEVHPELVVHGAEGRIDGARYEE